MTAVEFLLSKTSKHCFNKQEIDQAKEMEKQQIIEFAEYCVELQYNQFKTGEEIEAETMEQLLEQFKKK